LTASNLSDLTFSELSETQNINFSQSTAAAAAAALFYCRCHFIIELAYFSAHHN